MNKSQFLQFLLILAFTFHDTECVLQCYSCYTSKCDYSETNECRFESDAKSHINENNNHKPNLLLGEKVECPKTNRSDEWEKVKSNCKSQELYCGHREIFITTTNDNEDRDTATKHPILKPAYNGWYTEYGCFKSVEEDCKNYNFETSFDGVDSLNQGKKIHTTTRLSSNAKCDKCQSDLCDGPIVSNSAILKSNINIFACLMLIVIYCFL